MELGAYVFADIAPDAMTGKHTSRQQRIRDQMDVGALLHDKMMHAIELFETLVAPAIRKALG